MDETDNQGKYRFPPLDEFKSYNILAKKDTYVIVGPDNAGNFIAHKLAEVIVEVVDQQNGSPLQVCFNILFTLRLYVCMYLLREDVAGLDKM